MRVSSEAKQILTGIILGIVFFVSVSYLTQINERRDQEALQDTANKAQDKAKKIEQLLPSTDPTLSDEKSKISQIDLKNKSGSIIHSWYPRKNSTYEYPYQIIETNNALYFTDSTPLQSAYAKEHNYQADYHQIQIYKYSQATGKEIIFKEDHLTSAGEDLLFDQVEYFFTLNDTIYAVIGGQPGMYVPKIIYAIDHNSNSVDHILGPDYIRRIHAYKDSLLVTTSLPMADGCAISIPENRQNIYMNNPESNKITKLVTAQNIIGIYKDYVVYNSYYSVPLDNVSDCSLFYIDTVNAYNIATQKTEQIYSKTKDQYDRVVIDSDGILHIFNAPYQEQKYTDTTIDLNNGFAQQKLDSDKDSLGLIQLAFFEEDEKAPQKYTHYLEKYSGSYILDLIK